MIRAIAIDDEPIPLEILAAFASKIPEKISLLATFTKLEQAKKYLDEHKVDLIFLDIRMPMLSGTEFYRVFGNGKLVIFCTAYSEYAIEAFELEAVDYLLKPFDFDRFVRAVEKALFFSGLMQNPPKDFWIYFKSGSEEFRVQAQDIFFAEAMSDYIRIHLIYGIPIVIRMTMKGLEEKLGEKFIRIHKSFLVHVAKVESFGPKSCHVGGKSLPIGDSYRKNFLGRIAAFSQSSQ